MEPKTREQMQAEMDELINEVIEKEHIGKITETESYKAFVAAIDEAQRHMDEQRAENQPRQMMGCEDVVAALGVSRSTAYQIIRRLNKELDEAGYIVVRGKVSRAYFEKRTYGISTDE